MFEKVVRNFEETKRKPWQRKNSHFLGFIIKLHRGKLIPRKWVICDNLLL